MDLLCQRYASPFSFMDGMIKTGRFHDFVIFFWNNAQKEKDEEASWQFFLHRVFDRSYSSFKEELKTNGENQNMSEQAIETTINHSLNILNNFNPETGGEK